MSALVDFTVAGHENSGFFAAFMHCLREKSTLLGNIAFWREGKNFLGYVKNSFLTAHTGMLNALVKDAAKIVIKIRYIFQTVSFVFVVFRKKRSE